MLFGLVACSQTEKAADLKKKLDKGGYKVSEYSPAEFDANYTTFGETGKIDGLKTVLVATKGEQGIFLFVFGSIKQAEAAATPEFLGMLGSSVKEFCDEDQASVVGYHNNVIWGGSQKARETAGLNTR